MLRDCSKALSINPRSAKAFYRSAVALLSLERAEEAIDCCDRCLDFDPKNQGVQTTRDRALSKKREKDKKEGERLERIRKEQEAKRLLNIAFQVSLLVPPSS